MVGIKQLGRLLTGKKAPTSDSLKEIRQKAFFKEKVRQAKTEGRQLAKKKPMTFGQRYYQAGSAFGGSFGASSALGFEPSMPSKKKKGSRYRI